MQFSVTFRHMEATDALKSYAQEKLQKIKKYFPDPIAVHVVMSTERGYNHRADVNVQLHNGLKIAGHEETSDMYSAIDQVVQKIESQVRRYKDKLRRKKDKRPSSFAAVTWTHSVITETESDGNAPAEPASSPEATVANNPSPAVVKKTEKFHASPMSVAEAIMQMNLLHQEFLVFRCEDTGAVNVVYRRADGTFGLIETPPPGN